MILSIFADATVAYKRQKGNGSTSVNGSIKEFVGDDFVVGIFFLTTSFDITEPPYKRAGVWTMTVDGVQLTRTSE